MLKTFKDLDKNEQYQIIVNEIKKIEEECIELNDLLNQTTNYKNKKLVITKRNKFPLSVDMTVDLIYNSKLSNEFKKLLIEEINSKLVIIKNNKTR